VKPCRFHLGFSLDWYDTPRGNDDGRLVAGGETERQDGGHGCAKHALGIPRKCARDSGAAIEAIRPIIRPRLCTIAPMLALDDCRAAFPAWGDQDDADRFEKRAEPRVHIRP